MTVIMITVVIVIFAIIIIIIITALIIISLDRSFSTYFPMEPQLRMPTN